MLCLNSKMLPSSVTTFVIISFRYFLFLYELISVHDSPAMIQNNTLWPVFVTFIFSPTNRSSLGLLYRNIAGLADTKELRIKIAEDYAKSWKWILVWVCSLESWCHTSSSQNFGSLLFGPGPCGSTNGPLLLSLRGGALLSLGWLSFRSLSCLLMGPVWWSYGFPVSLSTKPSFQLIRHNVNRPNK